MIPQESLSTVTSLRILIPLILVLCVVAVTLKRIQTEQIQSAHRILPIKFLITILLGIYFLIYIHLTFTYRHPSEAASMNLKPLWSYLEAFQLNPLKIIRLGLARQILLNILLTIPLGLLLPVLYDQAKHPYLLTILTALVLSILTETVQYITHRGLCETDDVINNLIGCLLGIVILIIGSRLIGKRPGR